MITTHLGKCVLILIIFILSSPLWASSQSKRETLINHLIPALETKIEQTMKAQGIPGVAVAIVSRDEIHYLKTFGVKHLGKQDKILTSTLFQIASLSKPVNATMLGVLQEQGKVSLYDPVQRYIPGFQIRSNRSQLKICHLMSHSTGVPNIGFNEMIEAYAPRDKVVNRLQKVHPIAAPGKQYAYHNAMYGVIEDVIVSAAEKPLDKVLKEGLFEPLGMKRACLGLTPLLIDDDKAYPHIPNGRGKYVPAENYSRGYYAFQAAGGINASIEDLIPFLQLYLGKPSPIISKEILQELTTPFVKNNRAVIVSEAKEGVIKDTFYGMGWHSMTYKNQKVVYHQGHLKGFRHFMGFLRDDVGIIILTNADKKHASKIALKFFDLYLHG